MILLYSTDYLPLIGGVAAHVHGLARALVAKGERVWVVTSRDADFGSPSTWRCRTEQIDDVPVIRLSEMHVPFEPIGTRWRAAISRALGADAGDGDLIVHTHEGEPWFFRGQRLNIFTNHTSMFLQDLDVGSHDMWRRKLSGYDWVLAPSRELAERTVEAGFDADRVTYIPNAVDVDEFKPDPELRRSTRKHLDIAETQTVILLARRFTPKNGVIDFAHGLGFLSEMLPEEERDRVTVVCAGNSGRDHDAYEREVLGAMRQSPLGRSARLLGQVPVREMKSVMAMADLSLLPSLKEATSIAGLESMASGVPIVGTRTGGIPEIVEDGEDGRLVERGDPRGFAEALRDLILDRQQRLAFGERARAKAVEHFSWPRVAELTLEAYQRAMQVAQPRGNHG